MKNRFFKVNQLTILKKYVKLTSCVGQLRVFLCDKAGNLTY